MSQLQTDVKVAALALLELLDPLRKPVMADAQTQTEHKVVEDGHLCYILRVPGDRPLIEKSLNVGKAASPHVGKAPQPALPSPAETENAALVEGNRSRSQSFGGPYDRKEDKENEVVESSLFSRTTPGMCPSSQSNGFVGYQGVGPSYYQGKAPSSFGGVPGGFTPQFASSNSAGQFGASASVKASSQFGTTTFGGASSSFGANPHTAASSQFGAASSQTQFATGGAKSAK
eukprot:g19561.t1